MRLKAGNQVLNFERPLVMGVLNVTPDSFSDGGKFMTPDDALRHAEQMVIEGADIIDVGGESTRPGAGGVDETAEIDRIIPVIDAISSGFDVMVSADTSKSGVMVAAAAAGATIINDIYALRREGALEAVANLDVAICLMHMQGTPQDMQEAPHYESLPGDIISFLDERIRTCVDAGISPERLVVDPGFGFGKHDLHNLRILAGLDRLTDLERPILVGLSRKRTLGNLTGKPVNDRVAAGLAAAGVAIEKGASIVRTHDVAATVDMLKVLAAVSEQEIKQ